jgi:hypothetical protein
MAGVLLYDSIGSAARDLLASREREQADPPVETAPDPAPEPPLEDIVVPPLESAAAPPPEPEPAPPPPPKAAPRPTTSRPIRQVPPSVPEGIRNRIVGEILVDIAIRIGADGRVTSARPAASIRNDGLRSYLASRAVEAARQWRYSPATSGGRAVPSDALVRFRFRRAETRWN